MVLDLGWDAIACGIGRGVDGRKYPMRLLVGGVTDEVYEAVTRGELLAFQYSVMNWDLLMCFL